MALCYVWGLGKPTTRGTQDGPFRCHARLLLHDIYAERLGQDAPIVIRTGREATLGEIDLGNWHHKKLAAESKKMNRTPRKDAGGWKFNR